MEEQQKQDRSLLRRLFDFQGETFEIVKDKKAGPYMYAPLDTIMLTIRPYLQKHGIGILHNIGYCPEHKKDYVKTAIYNAYNEAEVQECITYTDDSVKLQGMNSFQVLGATITYFKRYHVVALLGLTTEDDSDVGGTQNNGRGQDKAKGPDFMLIFQNYITKGKTEDEVKKLFNTYKDKMENAVAVEVKALIIKTFEDAKK